VDWIRRIIREAHRRSLWQVLSVYLMGSWGALQVVEVVTENAGLPDWVFPFALVLLVIGLPVVMATALVQEGVGGPRLGGPEEARIADPQGASSRIEMGASPGLPKGDSGPAEASVLPQQAHEAPEELPGAAAVTSGFRQRLFTWRNALTGGAAAFATLGLAVAGYFMMWSQGIGPVGSLAARGVLLEGDQVVLADFHNATTDPVLSSVVTEALRIDLARSGAFTLAEPAVVRQVLARMQRDPSQALTAELAREVAEREGMKAVLEGEVGSAGTGYILSATLRSAATGETLASFRRTAEGPERVVRAIDRLSEDIREKAGESLRSIRRAPRLGEVTTPSLDALKRFTEAEERFDEGDGPGTLALLQEAIALDSTFAMAHRKLAITLLNMNIDRHRQVEALEAAQRHRHRLTERERLITEATYHHVITGDQEAIIRAYDGVLRINPHDRAALNNLANSFMATEEFDRAAELYERAVSGPGTSNTAHSNLVRVRLLQGDLAGARKALSVFGAEHPDDPLLQDRGFWVHAWAGEWEEAEDHLATWEARRDLSIVVRLDATLHRARLAAARGQMEAARRYVAQALRLARSEIGPAQEWIHSLHWAFLERATGGEDRARAILRELEERRLFDEIPFSARDYGLVIVQHNGVGHAEEALHYLRRWREEMPPELAGRYDEAQRELHQSMLGGAAVDPQRTLNGIEGFRDRLRCRRCYRVEEAEALEAAGRRPEAQEAWRRVALNLQHNFLISFVERARAWERMGILADELGDVAGALQAYGRFAELWADADPELQPRVQRARDRITALEAEG
jgi:eukaryotic-like serine/threonine-protein kinase